MRLSSTKDKIEYDGEQMLEFVRKEDDFHEMIARSMKLKQNSQFLTIKLQTISF